MYKIAVLPGDGIGPEIITEAVKVLKIVGLKYEVEFSFTSALMGGCAIDATGTPLPDDTLALCKSSQAILFGAVGGPKWDALPLHLRPEAGALLPLRKMLGLYANLRPVSLFPALVDASTLKREVIEGIDLLVIRELTGGLYFGEKKRERRGEEEVATDTMIYSTSEIERILRLGFETARERRGALTSVDKANVLETSRLWREVATRLAGEYPDVKLEHMYVDNCAMQLVKDPRQFDVIVTENMFGDILTDQASMLGGSIGMLASASIGGQIALYEPAHGSAPDIAGQKKANPIATILSAAMMLKYSFGLKQAAGEIEHAVGAVLDAGCRTPDLFQAGQTLVNTEEMGALICKELGN
ncbi:MAG: 3-isopropylmalate dehydrogenase [Bacillota bacterium]